MKKIRYIFFISCFLLTACSEDNDRFLETVDVTFRFTQNWKGIPITASDFNEFKFTNQNGDLIGIERLRYLVSNITIGSVLKDYQLIDVGEGTGLEFVVDEVTKGLKTLNFTFGFKNEDNLEGSYQDLNSVSFNVPELLGGGYHFMQFDGKYKDHNNQDANFNYHVIRAADNTDPTNVILEDTSFEVDLGELELNSSTVIEIKMDVSEWFKNPNTWSLQEFNTRLMPNFGAQKLMEANGQSVFSLGEIKFN